MSEVKRTVFKVTIFLSAFAMISTGSGQTLGAKVSLQADRIRSESDQEILSQLPRQIINYINNYDWTGENYDIMIDIELNFVVESVTSRASERIYIGRLLTISPSGENVLDRNYEFPYQPSQLWTHDQMVFNPLLSLIDYYVYLMLGGELDTYFLEGGTFYYNRALSTAEQGLISEYSRGWRNRLDQVNSIRGSDHLPLRHAKFYYYEGLFYIEERRDTQKGPELAIKAVDLIEEAFKKRPNSAWLKRFFDTHYQEFCTLFSLDSDRENITRMMAIDNRHRESYEECGKEIRSIR